MFNNNNLTIVTYPRSATIFASICAILFIIIGFIGNLVTIIALLRCPKLRGHATTAFVLSLCVSDLLFCTLSLPLTAARYINEEWTLGEGLCKLFPVLFYGNVAVSLLSMVAITLNRYILISYHAVYTRFYTNVSICIQLLLIWGLAFLIMLPPLLGVWGQLGLDKPTFSCTILKKDGHSPKKVIFLIGFVVPCVVIITSYSCIYWRVKRSRQKLQAHSGSEGKDNGSGSRERDDSRLTKLMLTIFICFVLCFLPLMLVNVLDDNIKYPTMHVVGSVLAWASSVINPFIYAGSNRQYRTAYRKLFTGLKNGLKLTSRESQSHSGNSGKTCVTDLKLCHKNSEL